MSRIQEILARAERDGTARRTKSSPAVPHPAVAPPVDGTAALDRSTFLDGTSATLPGTSARASAVIPEPMETRTASATLHPALVAGIDPQSPVAEQYRTVRTRLMMQEDTAPVRVVLITSPGAAEGKSVTAANLALTMAQEFQRNVVLMDADLRDPSIHALFGIEGLPGLSEVLTGRATLDEALVHLPDFRLTILPAGAVAQYPTELLGSSTMRRTVDTLRARFDRVLLDLPAVMPLADVGTVAPLSDGVVMVVRAGVTQRPTLEQALAAFDEERVLGIVLNEAT